MVDQYWSSVIWLIDTTTSLLRIRNVQGSGRQYPYDRKEFESFLTFTKKNNNNDKLRVGRCLRSVWSREFDDRGSSLFPRLECLPRKFQNGVDPSRGCVPGVSHWVFPFQKRSVERTDLVLGWNFRGSQVSDWDPSCHHRRTRRTRIGT